MKPTTFHFEKYVFSPQKQEVKFYYSVTGRPKKLHFSETILLPKKPIREGLSKKLLSSILRDLHLVVGVSYYKMFLSQKVTLPYDLTTEQAAFWSKIYRDGHGELLFRNNVDPNRIARFPDSKKAKAHTEYIWQQERSLVGIGGGKDSIVGAELLKSLGQTIGAFHVSNDHASTIVSNVTKLVGVPSSVEFIRKLDPQVFDTSLSEFQGHIPISVAFAFLGVFGALLYDYRYVVVSNEKSSNFGSIEYKGLKVNHQWSKSEEVEVMIQQYVRNFVTPSVIFYSQIRAFHEIRVAKLFAKHEKYFYTFSSCNRAYKMQGATGKLWCGECAKCCFVFLMLAPFVAKKKLLNIFGKNLLNDPSLISLYSDLLGYGGLKPFDCVGTFDESKTAFLMIKKKFSHDIVVKTLISRVKISEKDRAFVLSAQDVPTIPARFRFLGLESVAILGYGKEGQVSKEYLKKFYPSLRVGVLDKKFDKNYLEKQRNFEVAIKTPVIPQQEVTIPHTTATNIFLSHVQNTIIGVTGTKGKSTTASLIFHILKTGGVKAELFGNIGKPMLERVFKPVAQDTIFVLELSSYQLDDIHTSPHIAVVTTLFPEHMDYHQGQENYYNAKKHIIGFQSPADMYIYDPATPLLKKWVKNTLATAIPAEKSLPVSLKQTHLIGNHNAANARLAVTVARKVGVSSSVIAKALKTFVPLPHRLQNIGTFGGITFYDDAISTTPESTIAALRSLGNVSTIFLGGEDRGYDFTELEKVVSRSKVTHVVLFPDTGRRIFKKTSPKSRSFNILHTKSMKDAIQFAYNNAPRGSIVLLSCASPSYSLWKNFEEKGDQFQQYVKQFRPKKYH